VLYHLHFDFGVKPLLLTRYPHDWCWNVGHPVSTRVFGCSVLTNVSIRMICVLYSVFASRVVLNIRRIGQQSPTDLSTQLHAHYDARVLIPLAFRSPSGVERTEESTTWLPLWELANTSSRHGTAWLKYDNNVIYNRRLEVSNMKRTNLFQRISYLQSSTSPRAYIGIVWLTQSG